MHLKNAHSFQERQGEDRKENVKKNGGGGSRAPQNDRQRHSLKKKKKKVRKKRGVCAWERQTGGGRAKGKMAAVYGESCLKGTYRNMR